MNPQEAGLIERLKAGEEAAFQTLFRDYYPVLCVYAKRLTGDADGAREVVQDLFVRLYEGRQTLPALGSLKSYLYAAVRNACLNQLKRNQTRHQHHQRLLYQAPTGEDTDALVQLELEEKIWRAVQDLPEQCRKIFRMNRFEDKKNRQIAEELGISVRTVETQISKALRLLRGALSDFLPLLLLLAAGRSETLDRRRIDKSGHGGEVMPAHGFNRGNRHRWAPNGFNRLPLRLALFFE